MSRVYIPCQHQLGTVSGRVIRGFPGIVMTEEIRISLDDGRSVLADRSEVADAHNVALFPIRRMSSALLGGLAAVDRMGGDGPDAA